MRNSVRGFSLLELLVVLVLAGLFLVVASANLSGAARQRDFEAFETEVVGMLETCRWRAMNERRYAGVWFEKGTNGYEASLFVDGNDNGIRAADIQAGVERRVFGPTRLHRALGDIAPGILADPVPQIPPKSGVLTDPDPVRFGKSDLVSFSPNGDSSSGTLYLACYSQSRMYAIVLYGPTARMTVWKLRNFEWQMVEDR